MTSPNNSHTEPQSTNNETTTSTAATDYNHENSDNGEDLVSIHREMWNRWSSWNKRRRPYYDDEEETLRETLDQLKKKKILLTSKLAVMAQSSITQITTLADTLSMDYNTEALFQQQQTNTVHPTKIFQQPTYTTPTTDDETRTSTTSTNQLINTLSMVRKQRRFIGAHRLSGISTIIIPNTDPHKSGCIGARFDLCDDGEFNPLNNRQPYYVFFDWICTSPVVVLDNTSTSNATQKRLQLRLAQHTLPKAVSVTEVIRRRFHRENNTKTKASKSQQPIIISTTEGGGVIAIDLGPYSEEDEGVVTEEKGTILMSCLRTCLGAIYDALHAHAQRILLKQWLMSVHNNNKIQDLLYSNAHDRISFDFALLRRFEDDTASSSRTKIQRTLKVQLTYEDEPLPKKVSLRWADILDHLDVHWFLPDVAAYMRMYPIPNVLNMIEQAAEDELLSPRGINTNS